MLEGVGDQLKKAAESFAAQWQPFRNFMDAASGWVDQFNVWLADQPGCAPEQAQAEIEDSPEFSIDEKEIWINLFGSLHRAAPMIWRVALGKLKGLWIIALTASVFLLLSKTSWADGPDTATQIRTGIDLFSLVIGLLGVGIPAAIALARLFVKDQKTKDALDKTEQALNIVVGAVGQAKRQSLPAESIKEIMSIAELTAYPSIIEKWKAAVKRMDPKKSN